ncbi:hypothetical protein JTB14_029472 [Gonioctena quinquepunctata]|nr:hypothetical protein JTB14_029472 [Gonioctena quinquepunctata]
MMNMEVTHRAEIENLTLNQTQCESCKAEQHKQRRRQILTKDDRRLLQARNGGGLEGWDSSQNRYATRKLLGNGEVNEEAEDENIFKALSIVKLTMLKHGKKKLAIPEMEGVTGLIVCRVLEFPFVNTDIEILLMKTRPQQHSGKQQASSRTVNRINQVKPKHDALLVKELNASYADS